MPVTPRRGARSATAIERSSSALLLIDVINDLEFPGGEKLARFVLPMARRLARLKTRARAAGIPVIYVNDNFGRWRSDFRRLVEHCLEEGARGRAMVQLLEPDEQDYFVLKTKHSCFYATSLEALLRQVGAGTLILGGIAGDICVLFTANDAYLRDYEVVVPSDCVASETRAENRQALAVMRKILAVRTTPSGRLRLDRAQPRRPKPGRPAGRRARR
jgi:nicotinamidase-related amidase